MRINRVRKPYPFGCAPGIANAPLADSGAFSRLRAASGHFPAVLRIAVNALSPA
jgi:hypothetical protein